MKRESVIGVVVALAATGCGSRRPAVAPGTTAPNPHMPVPPVLVQQPRRGAVVGPEVTVSGTASARTVTIELVRRGRVLARRTARSSPRGTFTAELRATPGDATIEARTSAPPGAVDVPVTVSP